MVAEKKICYTFTTRKEKKLPRLKLFENKKLLDTYQKLDCSVLNGWMRCYNCLNLVKSVSLLYHQHALWVTYLTTLVAIFPSQQCPAGKTSYHARPSPKKYAGGPSFLSVSQMNPDYVTEYDHP